jgi:hypothetical protein
MRCVGHGINLKKIRNAFNTLERKSECKKSLGIPQRTWEDNIKMGLKSARLCGLDSTDSGYGPCASI